jgi:hypothetical protein
MWHHSALWLAIASNRRAEVVAWMMIMMKLNFVGILLLTHPLAQLGRTAAHKNKKARLQWAAAVESKHAKICLLEGLRRRNAKRALPGAKLPQLALLKSSPQGGEPTREGGRKEARPDQLAPLAVKPMQSIDQSKRQEARLEHQAQSRDAEDMTEATCAVPVATSRVAQKSAIIAFVLSCGFAVLHCLAGCTTRHVFLCERLLTSRSSVKTTGLEAKDPLPHSRVGLEAQCGKERPRRAPA